MYTTFEGAVFMALCMIIPGIIAVIHSNIHQKRYLKKVAEWRENIL